MDRLTREQLEQREQELVALCTENEEAFWDVARNYGLLMYSDPWELAYAAADALEDTYMDDEDRQERAARECRVIYGIDPEDVDENSVVVVEEDIGKAYVFNEDSAISETVNLLMDVLDVDVDELTAALE